MPWLKNILTCSLNCSITHPDHVDSACGCISPLVRVLRHLQKLSVRANNVPVVLWLNTLFGSLLLSPVILQSLTGNQDVLPVVGHAHIMLKALIVLGSWILGYFAIKHLPLTIQGPVNATRPVLVLIERS